jgi:hypothetical protein
MTDNTKEFTPDEHSRIVGGSSAALLIACPGSYQAQQGYPPEQESPDAFEGTACHEAVAWILANDEEPESVIDRTFYGFYIDEAVYTERIAPAIDLFDRLAAYYEDTDGDFTFVIEQRCAMPGIPDAFGTSDIVFKTPKRVGIIDWKFGFRKVSAVENAQGQYYGKSALFSLKTGFFKDDSGLYQLPDTPVDIIIIQPRIDYGFDEVVHHDKDIHTSLTEVGALWTTTVKGLEDFRMTLVAKVAEAQGKDPALNRGSHCKDYYCRAISGCKAWTGVIDKLNEVVAANPVKKEGKEIRLSTPPSPDRVAEILAMEKDVNAFFKAVKGIAFDMASAGTGIPGYKLVNNQGNRAWIEEDQSVILKQLIKAGLKQNDCVTAPKLKGPKPIEDLLKLQGKDLPEGMVHRPITGRSLVPRTAKGEEISATSTALLELAKKLEGPAKKA